jgi:hypothetical protein
MSKPIPDAVLRRLVDVLAAGDTLTFLTSAGHERISAKGAFSELLALRQAARAVLPYLKGEAKRGNFVPSLAVAALEEVLPEEPS